MKADVENGCIRVAFDSHEELAREFKANLRMGGLFVPGLTAFEPEPLFEVVLIHPENQTEIAFLAQIVRVDSSESHPGTALAIEPFSKEFRTALESFVHVRAAADDQPRNNAQSAHERIRAMSIPEQLKVARGSNAAERIILERIYGKTAWEPILRNAKVTIPEIVRIARMGTLPRPLLEIIVTNNAFIASPQVRRALLSNPHLTPDMIEKILRATPLNELRLACRQTSYSHLVRSAAKKMLKEP